MPTLGSGEMLTLPRAVIRAADRLGISQKVLASILGLSEPTISRMRKGSSPFGQNKAFELAQLFIQVYAALDRMVAGDEAAARAWLTVENPVLRGRPVDLIQSVRGLVEVVGYLRARSSL